MAEVWEIFRAVMADSRKRRRAAIAGDIVLVAFSYYLAFLIRFEMELSARTLYTILSSCPVVILCRMASNWYFGLYRGVWRFASMNELLSIIKAASASSLLVVLVFYMANGFAGYPRSIFLIDWLLIVVLLGGSRFAVRFCRELAPVAGRTGKRVLVVGAGDAGDIIVREMLRNRELSYHPVGFVDDDPAKIGSTVHGIEVLGDVASLETIAAHITLDEIVIAIPTATAVQMERIGAACERCGVPYKTLPGIGEIIDGKISISALREVDYHDLLGRPHVELDAGGISEYVTGRTVLVTGCGGSIGSELCRQLVRFSPRLLVLVDASEENLYSLQMDLQHQMNFHSYRPFLCKVQNHRLINEIFKAHLPEVVFHAAAYKHVPMMELNPWEAVFNNIVGSQVVMEAAVRHGAKRFVLVSTDKAVRPTNVMGASKRVTEMLLESHSGGGTRLVAVRFGNVVGSSGSVVPLFRRQIEHGGPVTVTHPEVTRYFMTINEAAQLVLQAGGLGNGGEIFVLDMGEPVKILEMAKELIRLSGKDPEHDIEIVLTGLREGEKLYEECICEGEDIVRTMHQKILVLESTRNGTSFFSRRRLERQVAQLQEAAIRMDGGAIRRMLREIVPEYTPQEGTVLPEAREGRC
ncbi:polysaccharide biosynthesis protein [Geomonas sp. RF6]|uniref:nucleoside-diphosphate sugar epimerase/dehydratase n=1 Tax=Geomonas sp. RF6 TaxID=2897342 RepID=UPI001E590515|nr:nucleoside-diphosphate sugar epimerase/dehydratase [Geomonas sp. RF6]UFS69338.1 polysaccharide biosynthesis protein [Geomonas sp. RF6]